MANMYAFRFHSIPAEFKDGCITLVMDVVYRGGHTHLVSTWAEAKIRFAAFAADTPAPRACFMYCDSKPKPPGWSKAETTIYRRESDNG